MANHTVQANQLNEGSLILIRGNLGFARLTRIIDGEELARTDQRRVQNGMRAIGKPHTTVTISNAQVLPKQAELRTPEEAAFAASDPDGLTREERYVAERRYVPKARPESGQNYSIQSKGSILPVIVIPTEDGKLVQDTSGKELAQGLDVTLVLRVYKAKGQDNRGLDLAQVIVNEPVRYYTPNNAVTDDLAARGLVFAGDIRPISANEANGQGEAAPIDGPELDDRTIIDENGFAMPAPGPSVAQQPAAAPAVQAAPAQAPAAPAAAPQGDAEALQAQIARLEAEKQALLSGQQVGSAIGAPSAAASPWNTGQQAGQGEGIRYGG